DSADVRAGARTFGGECASCHGAGARGRAAPALDQGHFRHGGSDWALLRNIRAGIPGTAMPPHPKSRDDLWRLVAYIRSLDTARANPADVHAAPAPAVTPARLAAAPGG